MKTTDILKRLEEALHQQLNTESKPRHHPNDSSYRELLQLFFLFTIRVMQKPFEFVSEHLKKDIIPAIEKDAKLYALLIFIFGALFLLTTVIWVSISVAVGFFFYENGYSMFASVMFSLAFQAGSALFLIIIAYLFASKIKSLQILRKVSAKTREKLR